MAAVAMKNFMSELSKNETFAESFKSAVDGKEGHAAVEVVAAFAKANGHDVSEADVTTMMTKASENLQDGDLSDEQLDGVAGGGFLGKLFNQFVVHVKDPVKTVKAYAGAAKKLVDSF